jgi:hypothetical protein
MALPYSSVFAFSSGTAELQMGQVGGMPLMFDCWVGAIAMAQLLAKYASKRILKSIFDIS